MFIYFFQRHFRISISLLSKAILLVYSLEEFIHFYWIIYQTNFNFDLYINLLIKKKLNFFYLCTYLSEVFLISVLFIYLFINPKLFNYILFIYLERLFIYFVRDIFAYILFIYLSEVFFIYILFIQLFIIHIFIYTLFIYLFIRNILKFLFIN